MKNLLRQTCTIAPKISSDRWGDAAFSAAVSYPCRAVKSQETIQKSSGEDIVVSLKVQIIGTANADDLLTYNSKKYIIIKPLEWVDGSGNIFGSLLLCQDLVTPT